LFAGAFACGCSDAGTPGAAATPVVETSSADTLVLIVHARISAPASPELAGHEGEFVDKRQIKKVTLSVDGRDWGTYATADWEEGVSGTLVSGFALEGEPSAAVVPAVLGTAEAEDGPRETAGDWTDTIGDFVQPGGHVLGIDAVTLTPTGGEEITLFPNLAAPFEVAMGATSAFAGTFEIEFSGEGAAQ
jgi:hypothetical protein